MHEPEQQSRRNRPPASIGPQDRRCGASGFPKRVYAQQGHPQNSTPPKRTKIRLELPRHKPSVFEKREKPKPEAAPADRAHRSQPCVPPPAEPKAEGGGAGRAKAPRPDRRERPLGRAPAPRSTNGSRVRRPGGTFKGKPPLTRWSRNSTATASGLSMAPRGPQIRRPNGCTRPRPIPPDLVEEQPEGPARNRRPDPAADGYVRVAPPGRSVSTQQVHFEQTFPPRRRPVHLPASPRQERHHGHHIPSPRAPSPSPARTARCPAARCRSRAADNQDLTPSQHAGQLEPADYAEGVTTAEPGDGGLLALGETDAYDEGHGDSKHLDGAYVRLDDGPGPGHGPDGRQQVS